MEVCKVLIADDQTLMRDGLKTILDLEEDLEVVGTAENGLEAYKMVGALRPHIVLMDIQMPVMDGLESIKRIMGDYPDTRILILTTFAEDEYIIEGLANGAVGFLLKDMHGDRLISAIREAAKGEMMLPASVAARLAARLAGQKPREEEGSGEGALQLTEREREVARLMLQGQGNREIAQALHISEGTVKNYISIIYSKIGTNDRVKAVVYLKELGIDR